MFIVLHLLCTRLQKAAASRCVEREIFHVAAGRGAGRPDPGALGPVPPVPRPTVPPPYPGTAVHFLACRAELCLSKKQFLGTNFELAKEASFLFAFINWFVFINWLSSRQKLEKSPGTPLHYVLLLVRWQREETS